MLKFALTVLVWIIILYLLIYMTISFGLVAFILHFMPPIK
jgi:hypothetical protein